MSERSRNLGRIVDGLQSRIRGVLTPLDDVARLVPSGGRVLDLGCGQGLIIQRFAARVDEVVGVDYDPRKCEMARRDLAGHGNVTIVEGDIMGFLSGQKDGGADAIVLADTLSAMPEAEQDRVLAASLRCLRRGGTLILKIISPYPRWKAAVSRGISHVVVRWLRLSRTAGQTFSYRPPEAYRALLAGQGCSVRDVILHRGLRPIPHVAVVAQKLS